MPIRVHLKTLLLMQYALDREYTRLEVISTCVLILIKQAEFETVIRVLEYGKEEFIRSDECICYDDILNSVVGCKTKNDILEMKDLIQTRSDIRLYKISVPVFFWYSLYVCHKFLGHKEKLHEVLKQSCKEYCIVPRHPEYIDALLILEINDHLNNWMKFHSQYTFFMSVKTRMIRELADSIGTKHNIPLFCTCNIIMRYWFCESTIQNSDEEKERYTKSTADRMYYAQILIFNNNIEEAISILNTVIETEGDYSLSVVILPKEVWNSNLLNDKLCKELMTSSADYVVFPTNLFARYLLVNAYNSLGQKENSERNLEEFRKLRERYSSVPAFDPMLNIVSKMFI